MPSWVVGVVGTFALSLILAYGFLRLRCRGVGNPFGRRAKSWAVLIMVATAIVSTGVGLILVAASRHLPAAYVGVVVPGGLWFSKLPPQRDRDLLHRTLAGVLTLPFSRLYDRMGDDMEAWCETRLQAASAKPQWIADAVTYYCHQVQGGLKDRRARADLDRWRESITHKISIVRLIGLDTTPARLQAALAMHPSTQHVRKYAGDDLPRLARRLETEALNELHLFLAYVYRLGHHRLLIYPFRPSAHRAPVREPTAPDR
ncbi:MAG: hypothetical protein ACLP8X_21970 [Streptosporangiaceae bacterium]